MVATDVVISVVRKRLASGDTGGDQQIALPPAPPASATSHALAQPAVTQVPIGDSRRAADRGPEHSPCVHAGIRGCSGAA